MREISNRGLFLETLAGACEERGTDATSAAYNENGIQRIYKRPLPAHKMWLRVPQESMVVMGHTRITTQGSEKQNQNNHPFREYLKGHSFALAHNGVLNNDRRLVVETGESRGMKEAQPTRKDSLGPSAISNRLASLNLGYELTNNKVLRRK